ncbi:MAG: aminopeptidase [Nitrospinota bacterium]
MVKYNMAATARRLVEQVVVIQPGEHVLLVTDSDRPPTITEALAHAIAGAGAVLSIMHMPPHKMGGIDPPRHVGAAMAASDVVILQTSFATIHTDTARAAMKDGARILEMWGFQEDMMTEGGAMADYAEVRRLSERLADLITRARSVRFTTPKGSDFRLSVEGRTCFPLFGLATEKGTFAAIPDGEAAVSPLEGTAEGVLVDPFCIERKDLGVLREPFGRIEVRAGKVVSMAGSPGAERFWRVLEENGETAKNLAEFALGTNPACRPYASIREGKKTWGTCHVAVGDSGSIGGKVVSPLHVDIVFARPTVYVDDQVVVQDGRVLA